MTGPSRLSFGLLASTFVSLSAITQGQDTTSALTSVQPAATSVPANSEAGVSLFKTETTQLTEEALERSLDLESLAKYKDLFVFDDDSVEFSPRERRTGDCIILPEDPTWPHEFVWKLFDLLLGGALVPIRPLASPCYKDSSYGNYDAERCAALVEAWDVPELQYVLSLNG